MKYKAVLFDLDGTLLDTINDIAASINAVLERAGYPTHKYESYKYFVGDGMRNLVIRALPECKRDNGQEVEQCLTAMRAEYAKRWGEMTKPYPGMEETLDALAAKGFKLAVLSNKPDEMTKAMIRHLLPRWNFAAVFGERGDVPKKPDPTAALEITKLLCVQPSEFILAGDSGVDMKTASAAGMTGIGVLWGFRDAGELLEGGARSLISKPAELLGLI